jgi:membrane associated rhomboid family serine protease/ribosomal protein S27AE
VADRDQNVLDAILRALGVNPVQLRWRWRRRRERMRGWFRSTENRSRALRYEHKTCPHCGSPADRDERVCPRCGAALSGAVASRAARALRLLLPEGAYVYTILIGLAIAVSFGVMVIRGGAGMLWPQSDDDSARMIELGLRLGASHAAYFDLERLCANLSLADLSGLCPSFPHVHRLVTNAFVHFGILHVIFNFYALIQLGPLLERLFGRSRFLVLYLVCGVAASAASLWWHWEQPVVSAGASGALFGLIGASIVYGLRRGGAFGRSLFSEMLRWGAFALLFGFVVNGVDNAAHIGGALAGAAMALVLGEQGGRSRIPPGVWRAAEAVCLAVIVLSFAALFFLDDPLLALFALQPS